MFGLSLDAEGITKGIGLVTASFAAIGGGWTMLDKFKDDTILNWAPEYFEISSGPVDGEFKVVVAREKVRDDCSVEGFTLSVRDSGFEVHEATPSIATFSGPATNKVDKFGYTFQIDRDHMEMMNLGEATLIGAIDYLCPEGPVIVTYPDGDNLRFNITEAISPELRELMNKSQGSLFDTNEMKNMDHSDHSN